MDDPLDIHRLHFAVTIVFHYLFPQLTMGLALLILTLKTMALRGGAAEAGSRFWSRIFAVSFVRGVARGLEAGQCLHITVTSSLQPACGGGAPCTTSVYSQNLGRCRW